MERIRALFTILRQPKVTRPLAALFSIGIFTLALWILYRTIGRFDVDEVTATIRAYEGWQLVATLLLTLASYAALSGFDILALRHLRKPVPEGWTGLISFVSHAVSHNAGFAFLTGGGVRLRMYAAFGLNVREVAAVITFAGLTFALGATAIAAWAFITEGEKVAVLINLPAGLVAGLGWLGAAILVAYVVWTGWMRRPLVFGKWSMSTPSWTMSLSQIAVAALDLALVAGALYVLLPLETISYPAFVGLYVVASLLGTLSHVPGGLGVFEGALVLLLPELEPVPLLAALLMYRGAYNLLPLVLAALILAVFEVVQRVRHAAEPEWVRLLGPWLGAMVAFGAGAMLLITGAIADPADIPRLIAEPAHLLSGAVAALLMVSAWGLSHQACWGYRIALTALVIGTVAALARGPDWGSAAVLAGAAAVLVATEPLFHRGRALGAPPMGWLGAAGALVAVSVWLTAQTSLDGWATFGRLFAFAADENGPRALRGAAVAAIALAATAVASRFAVRAREAEADPPTGDRRRG